MLRPLDIHPEARDEIRNIAATDKPGAARIMVLISQLQSDETLQEKLLERHTTAINDTIDIMQVITQRAIGLGRIKFLDMPKPISKYRIFYVFHPISRHNNTQSFSIMAVTKRSDDTYEPSSHTIQLIKKRLSD